jgi:outer membrane lipoprotein LolB
MRVVAFVLSLALAGCAAAPRQPGPVDWPVRQAELLAIDAWRMTGRVAVIVDGEGASASLDWRQAGENSDLALSGPLGVGALRAVLAPAGLSLEDGGGTRLMGAEAEAALAARLGTEIPLPALRYWLLGTPAPGMPAEVVSGADGRPAAFVQSGWQVEVGRYEPVAGGSLPTRLTLERGGARLKLAVSRWELP